MARPILKRRVIKARVTILEDLFVESLARRDGVSKSEAIRRLISQEQTRTLGTFDERGRALLAKIAPEEHDTSEAQAAA